MAEVTLCLDKPSLKVLPPLSLYVHLPWCLKKCPYCDFNSHERKALLPEAEYAAALLSDLEYALPAIWGRKINTIFFGGGTPSLFAGETIDALLAGIRARVPLLPDAEITLEANPGTFEKEKFREFRAAGINRLSLGVQSFNPRHLQALGRVHDEHEALTAAEAALIIFGNVNLDLMYGLPEQSLADCEADLTAALRFAPPHLSFYHLTIEPNTLFHRYPLTLPDHDLSADMQQLIETRLVEAGYTHYETSAYAKPGRQCRHNVNYWQFGDYLGIGAGAHSKLSFPERVIRQVRYKQPTQYVEQVKSNQPVIEQGELSRKDIGFEFMLNALRLLEGVPARLFTERTGYPLTVVTSELIEAERRGLLYHDHQVIRPTELGRNFLNDLQSLFLNDG